MMFRVHSRFWKISSSNDFIFFCSMHQDNHGYICLLIQGATKEDAGWYTVSAKNEAGIVSCTARLDVYSECHPISSSCISHTQRWRTGCQHDISHYYSKLYVLSLYSSILFAKKKKIHVTLSLSVYSFPTLIAKPLRENKPPSIARVFDCACWFLSCLVGCGFLTWAFVGLTVGKGAAFVTFSYSCCLPLNIAAWVTSLSRCPAAVVTCAPWFWNVDLRSKALLSLIYLRQLSSRSLTVYVCVNAS